MKKVLVVENDKVNRELMNLQLPFIDGYKATKIVRSNQDTKKLPIIVVSAHVMNEDRDKALFKEHIQ